MTDRRAPAGGVSLARQQAAETRVLEAVVTGAALPAVLETVARAVDELIPGIATSILLLDTDGKRLRHGAAPGLPESVNRAIDGEEIGPQVGSCGTAAFTREPVFVTDIATDPRWDRYRPLVAELGFRACWSTPVLDGEGRVLATFALYDRASRLPDESERALIERFAHLVGIAIGRIRQREALRASEERFHRIYDTVPVSIWEEDWSAIRATVERLRSEGVTDFRAHLAAHADTVADMLASMRVIDANDATLRMFGVRDRAEFERRLKAGALSADILAAFGKQVVAMAEGASSYQGEREFRTVAGETVHTMLRIAYPAPGSPSGTILASVMDVTALRRIDARLRESEERFRIIAQATADIIWDWNLKSGDVWWSDRYRSSALLEGHSGSLDADSWAAQIHPDDRERIVASIRAAIDRRQEHWTGQYRFRSGDRYVDIEDHGTLIFDETGEPVRFVGGMTDITERKRMEAQLRENEERFRIFADTTSVMIWDRDLVNGTIWRSGGLVSRPGTAEVAVETGIANWVDRVHPDDRARAVAGVEAAIAHRQERWSDQYRYRNLDGEWVEVEDVGRIVFDAAGRPARFIGGMTDITERKRMEARLRENEERFRFVADTTADRFWDWNLETGLLWWAGREGGSGEADIGTSVGPDLGERIWGDRLHPDDRDRVVAGFVAAIENRARKWRAQYRYSVGDGRWIEVEDRGQLLFDSTGKPVRFIGGMTDITERRHMEQQLRESEERFRIIARTTADVIWDWDLVRDVTWRSEGASGNLGGNDPEGAANSNLDKWSERVHPDDRHRVLDGLYRAIKQRQERWRDEYRFRGRDGTWVEVEDHGRLMFDDVGTPVRFTGGMTDITARKRAERDLRERIKELRCLYRAVELTSGDSRTVDSICADIAAILPASLLHEDVAVARVVVEGREHRSPGWQPPVATLVAPLRSAGREIGLVEIGYSAERPDERGGEGPFLAEERALVNAVAAHIGRMIDDRRMTETAAQADRLRAVGELTGGIAHDFNNLLTIVVGSTEMLASSLDDQPRLKKLAGIAMDAAERGAALTSRLLAFARKQALDPKSVDVDALIAGMEPLIRRTLGEQIEIRTTRGPGLWRTLVDASQLENALLNLCINARDAMPDGGRLAIETRNVEVDEPVAARDRDLAPGRYVMIAVSDTGTGMTPEVMARAFDPFFTTKEVGKGSGLGLSMVYGFVKQSRGHVSVYSEVGEGTTVKLLLPRAAEDDERAGAAAVPDAVPRGTERVLLVEDDEMVREHVASLLADLGYSVVGVADGRAALAVLREGEPFDLLFTDMVMPGGMNGRELAEAARALRPRLPVLFTTGYTEDAIVNRGRLDRGVHLLQKPYRRLELATKLREVLGR